ncbi:unnamed protein product [Dovyalis caffra]|uniref:Uncharacterized protein n=1 Tax=Dovyalis caffra TaxID=77055 RepID=A0AAV1SM52_9ROSI|nr:unnamed protein product [Dovyalis caffra]
MSARVLSVECSLIGSLGSSLLGSSDRSSRPLCYFEFVAGLVLPRFIVAGSLATAADWLELIGVASACGLDIIRCPVVSLLACLCGLGFGPVGLSVLSSGFVLVGLSGCFEFGYYASVVLPPVGPALGDLMCPPPHGLLAARSTLDWASPD